MNRVSVVEDSRSSKSRLAERVAQVLDVPYVGLDAIHYLVDWTPIDPDVFVAPDLAHLDFVRLTSHAPADQWLDSIGPATPLESDVRPAVAHLGPSDRAGPSGGKRVRFVVSLVHDSASEKFCARKEKGN